MTIRPLFLSTALLLAAPALADTLPATDCDRLAARQANVDNPPGIAGIELVALQRSDLEAAIAACEAEVARHPGERRFLFQLGRALDAAGRPEAAMAPLVEAAELGSAAAMSNAGLLHAKGRGVPQDYATALALFEKGVALGDAGAMVNLGFAYEHGQGVGKDEVVAIAWYRKAAALGSGAAMSNLGRFHLNGIGTPQHDGDARLWIGRAAALGNPSGMYDFGYVLENGIGGDADEAAARGWYENAIALGVTDALPNLAMMLDEGRGGAPDRKRAAELHIAAMAANIPWTYDEFLTHLDEAASEEVISGIQEFLKAGGFFTGPVDGRPGPALDAAVAAYRQTLPAQ